MNNMLVDVLARRFRRSRRPGSPTRSMSAVRRPVWNGNIDFSELPSTSRPLVQNDAGYTNPAYAPYGRYSSDVSHTPRFRVV